MNDWKSHAAFELWTIGSHKGGGGTTALHWVSYIVVIFITVVPHIHTPVLFLVLTHSCDSYPDGVWKCESLHQSLMGCVPFNRWKQPLNKETGNKSGQQKLQNLLVYFENIMPAVQTYSV